MIALPHRRVALPVTLVIVLTIILAASLPSSSHISFRRLQTASSSSRATAAAADLEATAKSRTSDPKAVEPLFKATYDQILASAAQKPLARDPCVDLVVSDGGNRAKRAKGTKVLVTGGAGFIGSNLVDRLLDLGYSVRIFDNLYTGYIRNVPLDNPNVELIVGDILDKEMLAKAVEGVEYVYHLAAMSKVVPSVKSSDMARFCTESNALGSWNVLDAVRKQGSIKKVVYAASSTYYGNQPAPQTEDMAPDFLTPYAASKYEGEIQMQMFDRLFSVNTISTRFFMVYGPRQPSTGAYAIVTGVFAKQAADGKPLTIEGDGSHYRDFIHVSDIVEGLILSQQTKELHGDVINLGSGTAYSVQDVANLVSGNQVHVDARANDLEGTLANTCKMRKAINYQTKKDFKTEMSYMAKETMAGNVFAQSWLDAARALSAPHLLPAGSPLFQWPRDTSDWDALVFAIKRVSEEAGASSSDVGRRMSLIMFSMTDDDTDNAANILLNTVFSLVRFGDVKAYMVGAMDDSALDICTTLNLPCYDARATTAAAVMSSLVSSGFDVHLAQAGNSYYNAIESEFTKETSNADIAAAKPSGDIFIRSTDKTKAALSKWAESAAERDSKFNLGSEIYSADKWPQLSVTKNNFVVE
ncbi:MAG: hypothetical protein LQ340_005026, partial [Diploschistes diacapsis]